MVNPDYKFVFTPSPNKKYNLVELTDGVNQRKEILWAGINDFQLLQCNGPIDELMADALDLAMAVSTADRLSVRVKDRRFNIFLSLPVWSISKFDNHFIKELLQKILFWFTGDNWAFEFRQKKGVRRIAELQTWMPLSSNESRVKEVALWSGGLDSLAGFLNRFKQNPDKEFILLGTGSNPMIGATQSRIFHKTRQLLHKTPSLIRVPITSSASSKLHRNSVQRSRGFVFMLIGAVCAIAEGIRSLHIYENGTGALNLPYTSTEVDLDHSRAVNPISLIYMEELLTHLLEEKFSIVNPFLFTTKAEMCGVFDSKELQSLIFETISCDSRHRKRPQQCGYCSSCLLRRQAIEANGIVDLTDYVIKAHDLKNSDNKSVAIRSMFYQSAKLKRALASAHPGRTFAREFTELGEVVDYLAEKNNIEETIIMQNFVSLFTRYTAEWDRVISSLSKNLIDLSELETIIEAA